jgi:hypothetical protein
MLGGGDGDEHIKEKENNQKGTVTKTKRQQN